MPERRRTFEYRLRRLACRQKLTLRKSRIRDEAPGGPGTYRLLDERGVVVLEVQRERKGAARETAPHAVEAYLTDETRPRYHMAHGGEYLRHTPLAAP